MVYFGTLTCFPFSQKKKGSLSNSVDEEFWEGIKQLIVA